MDIRKFPKITHFKSLEIVHEGDVESWHWLNKAHGKVAIVVSPSTEYFQ